MWYNDVLSLHQQSLLLSMLPWTTDSVVMQSSLAEGFTSAFPPPRDFVHAIEALEATILQTPHDLVWDALQVGKNTPSDLETFRPRVRTIPPKVMCIITALRLVDIMSWVMCNTGIGKVPHISRAEVIRTTDKKGWRKMSDWVLTLSEFSDTFRQLDSLNLGISPAALDGKDFLQSTCYLLRSKDATTCLINITIAAMHVQVLLQGNIDFPDSIQALFDKLQSFGNTLTDEDQTYLSGQWDMTKLRLPLHMALCISPLFLLIPESLHKKGYSRKELLLCWMGLGNETPVMVKEVERLLWRAIFSIACGQEGVIPAIKTFLSSLPDLRNISVEEKHWYQTELITSDSHVVDFVYMKGALPVGWPLDLSPSEKQEGLQLALSKHKQIALQKDTTPSVSQSSAPHLSSSLPPPPPPPPPPPSQIQTGLSTVPTPESQPEQTQSQSSTSSSPSTLPRIPGSQPAQFQSPTQSQSLTAVDSGTSSSLPLAPPKKRKIGTGYTAASQDPERRSTRSKLTVTIPAIGCLKSSQRHGGRREAQKAVARQAKPSVSSNELGSSFWNPIYLSDDDISLPALDVQTSPKKFFGAEKIVYGPKGNTHTFIPAFHDQKDLDRFNEFIRILEQSYVNGKPLHLAAPAQSAVAVYTESEFAALGDKKVLEVLRHRHILITDMAKQPFKFDEDGLMELKPLNYPVIIQDQSIAVENNFNLRRKTGTLQQMLECAKREDGGKILNALYFPLGVTADLRPCAYMTETHAWRITNDIRLCKSEPLPGDDLRWGLAATAGALHWYHIDSDGFGTFIDIKVGSKLWILARPKVNDTHDVFSSLTLFQKPYDMTTPCNDLWDIEAMYLTPGSRLIMRPNTPHAVYSPENTICMGGHFYATSTLQSTLFGIIHSFVAGLLVTNTEHMTAAQNLVRRMALFYHALLVEGQVHVLGKVTQHSPDLESSEGVLDLFSICILTELANILSQSTYTKEGMSHSHRVDCVHARAKCRQLISWFFHHYQLVDIATQEPLDGLTQVYWVYMVRIVKGLVSYMTDARAEGVRSEVGGLTSRTLNIQIKNCFEGNDYYHNAWNSFGTEEVTSLAWPKTKPFTVQRLQSTEPFSDSAIDGFTKDDMNYEKKQGKHKVV